MIWSVTETSYEALGRVSCAAVRMDSADFGASAQSLCQQDPTPSATHGPDRIGKLHYDEIGHVEKVEIEVGLHPAPVFEVTTGYTAQRAGRDRHRR